MVDDLNDLRDLSPEERIRRLKEREERKMREIGQARQLIQDSKNEIAEKKEKKEKLPLEQLKAVDMDHLASAEEKDIYKIKRFKAQNLETITEVAQIPDSVPSQRYATDDLSQQPTRNIYSQAVEIYKGIDSPEEVSREDFYSAMDIRYAIEAKQEAIKKGHYTASEALERETNAIKNMVDEIIHWYTG